MGDRKGMLATLKPELLAVATHAELVALVLTLASMVDANEKHIRLLGEMAKTVNARVDGIGRRP